MTLDQPTFQGGTKPDSSDASKTLSQATFANPVEFLQVLQKDFSKIDTHGGGITENDLIVYSQQGEDAAGRSAAKIAVDHFDALKSMTFQNHPYDDGTTPTQVITASDLKQDIAYAKGTARSLAPEIALEEVGDAVATVGGALATVFSAQLAVVSAVACPPVLVISAPLTAGTLGFTGYYAYHLATDGFATVASAQQRQQVFAGWSEINGGHANPGQS